MGTSSLQLRDFYNIPCYVVVGLEAGMRDEAYCSLAVAGLVQLYVAFAFLNYCPGVSC